MIYADFVPFKQELAVIQDMLRVFVMHIAYQKSEYGSVLLRPILSWISDCVCDTSYPLETDVYKVSFLLNVSVMCADS